LPSTSIEGTAASLVRGFVTSIAQDLVAALADGVLQRHTARLAEEGVCLEHFLVRVEYDHDVRQAVQDVLGALAVGRQLFLQFRASLQLVA
jgi:hypothetical protein